MPPLLKCQAYKGSARGFINNDWNTAPDTERPAPTKTAANILGRRISQIMDTKPPLMSAYNSGLPINFPRITLAIWLIEIFASPIFAVTQTNKISKKNNNKPSIWLFLLRLINEEASFGIFITNVPNKQAPCLLTEKAIRGESPIKNPPFGE